MFLLEWTASDLLLIALAGIAMIGTVVWLVPSAKVPRKRKYSLGEITAYDRQIPRYFLAAALSLIIGAIHIVVKSLPGFWQWLWQAGYGGHLFRDLSNSHIIIVGGGTVLLTGLTWYVLPRFVNRPLYSTSLAGASFWFTLIGVFGFYLAWLVLGLVEGNLVRHGMDYMAAKELVGSWHRVPTRMTASIMGVGYWTYVLNVFLTIWVGRHVEFKPHRYLTKFIAVSAAALFVGTVQGVIQVLPENADWIHYAGKFGEYVDPISHAHVNLVTGMMVALVGFLIFFSQRLGGKPLGEKQANRIFWSLVPGSILFYLLFLLLGLVLGGAVNGYGGLQIPFLVPFFSRNMPLLLSIAGTLMLSGFWIYFLTLWKTLDLRSLGNQLRQATPGAFWLVSSLAFVVGTLQGLLQVFPTTQRILTVAEEVPNIHAQLNMIGGVLLALLGLVYLLLPELVGRQAEFRLRRTSLWGISAGIVAYYLVTLTTGLIRFTYMKDGMDSIQAAGRLGWAAPLALVAAAIPLLVGFGAFGLSVYRASRTYRAEMLAEMRQGPARYAGPMPARLKRIPHRYVLGMEFAGGLFGWPGVGWLYAGKVVPALVLMLGGPAIAWALLPMLFSPYNDTMISQYGWSTLMVWLPVSALLSSLLLALKLRRMRSARNAPQADNTRLEPAMAFNPSNDANVSAPKVASSVVVSDSKRTSQAVRTSHRTVESKRSKRFRLGTAIGFGLVLLALISIPVVPMVMGIPDQVSQQPMMSELPERANGAYLAAANGDQSGLIKLFSWSFPVDQAPDEAPAINPAHFQNVVIHQKGLDDASSYHLFHVEDGDPISMAAEEVVFQRELRLTPRQPLEAGAYLLDIPIGGMFAGREYYYFRIDPSVTGLPELVQTGQVNALTENSISTQDVSKSESGIGGFISAGWAINWLEILPLSSAIISGWMALIMLKRMRQKIRPQEVAWSIAFGMFALAALSQVVGDLAGWSPGLARLYYLNGATLVVGWLGLGTWLVMVRRPRLRQAGIWSMLVLSGYAVGLLNLTPVDAAVLSVSGWHALQKPTNLVVLTIGINSLGTLVLVGGALWSAWIFWRKGILRDRMIGLVLLAVGALVVAAGGSLTRLGHEQYLYLAMSAGVALMFWGYLKTIQPLSEINKEDQVSPIATHERAVTSAGD
jgi:heme/copper-type cytochrome/quinol oxidase subunit 1